MCLRIQDFRVVSFRVLGFGIQGLGLRALGFYGALGLEGLCGVRFF